mmetsp:Transcript_20635/g.22863  ORF Transcript_20635/g.22863 Transcript_20635/m.22863 type:complete len:607 (-) Transcript_20635:150-1970(-)
MRSVTTTNDETTRILPDDDDVHDAHHHYRNSYGGQQCESIDIIDLQHQQEEEEENENNTDDRFQNLLLIALTPIGIKFFKSAQSSFQEYLMNDPDLHMSATTYGVILTLISMPIVPLLGGALLDYKGGGGGHHRVQQHAYTTSSTMSSTHNNDDEDDVDEEEEEHNINNNHHHHHRSSVSTSLRNNERKASQSFLFCGFLGLTLVGMIVYGVGLETVHSIPMGLLGATIFGVGEGCVMVAARAFVGHEFLGGDGAFAQGVLIAMNNLSMMASKNTIPWLIEHQKQQLRNHNTTTAEDTPPASTADSNSNSNSSEHVSILIGILACCIVQLISLGAGLLYATRNAGFCCQRGPLQRERQQQQQQQQEREREREENKTHQYHHFTTSTTHNKSDEMGCAQSGISSMATMVHLPLTFWIVATGRAIFLVTFKVFSRYSNSFLIEKFHFDAVAAGRISSVNELFALFSPVVGLLAYRSPGGIIVFAMGAGIVGAISLGSLAFFPESEINEHLPGGPLTPLVGISMAHGIIIPISIAMIPHTVPATQLFMAFAVFEVLGLTFNLTDIVFGWLRDLTGDYDLSMQVLFLYALLGTSLLYLSRTRIGAIHIGG